MTINKSGELSASTARHKASGHAIVEVALMSPWIFLLFIGIFDFGFYAYAAIATQNAANMAALYTSAESSTAGDAATACTYALNELNKLPNTRTLTSCSAYPVIVSATANPAGCIPTTATCDSTVSVTYRTVPLIPIPGLMGQMTFTGAAVMRVHPEQ
jgi:Flp pilus assembly protein TadG